MVVTDATAQDVCAVRLGISSFAKPNPNFEILPATEAAIREAVAARGKLCTNYFPTTYHLIDAISQKEVDIFISASGLYRRIGMLGVRDLGTVIEPNAPDPNHAEGSAIFVRADRYDLKTLADTRGMILAANHENGFTGYHTAAREVAKLGVRPSDFFRAIHFVGQDQLKVLEEVASGQADVGAVKTCLLEHFTKEHPEYRKVFRILDERETPGFTCRHSTTLYPNWVIATTAQCPPELSRIVAAAVLRMPPTENGFYWGIATDFSEVDALMRDLQIGPFSFLEDWSLYHLWREYKLPIVMALMFVFGLMAHNLRTTQLIRRRTEELNVAHERETALAREAAEASLRMMRMQKTATIGQMSSLIAHELRQPLASIRAFAHGLQRLNESERLTQETTTDVLGKLSDEAVRAETIVGRVRDYAKAKGIRREPVDINVLLKKAEKSFALLTRGARVLLAVESEPNLIVSADPLELELVLQNLLKNAAEALQAVPDAGIKLCAKRVEKRVHILISDNGPRLSDEAFAALSVPLSSEKPEGLGLGIGIVRSLVEAHGGRIVFERLDPKGLRVTVELPLYQDENDAANASVPADSPSDSTDFPSGT